MFVFICASGLPSGCSIGKSCTYYIGWGQRKREVCYTLWAILLCIILLPHRYYGAAELCIIIMGLGRMDSDSEYTTN